MDQRPVEQRTDVLVYTTQAAEAGSGSDRPGAGGAVRLDAARATRISPRSWWMCFPDGEARNLTDGILRLRYRNSLEKPELANSGRDLPHHDRCRRHRQRVPERPSIRLEISSSNFPRFDRNPNTGGPVADEIRLLKATQTVYHDQARPSHLLLMVMPGGG